MSLKALIEISIHLESFRNIDLFFQGLYYVKIAINQQKTNQNTVASQPYCIFTSRIQEEKAKKLKNADHHNLISSQISEENSEFLSRAFLIRYCEEEVEINDIALFRAELDVEPDYLCTEFNLEFQLFFSDLHNLGGPEKWQGNINEFEQKAVFKHVSTQKFKAVKLAQGVTEFVPITFDEQYFSVLNCQVQSVLLDFRFRVKSLEEIQSDLQKLKENSQTTDLASKNSVKDSRKSQRINNPQSLSTIQSKPVFTPSTIGEFFFADENGNMPKQLNMKEVDLIYNDYIRVMTCMHEKLKNTYNQFVFKFLTDTERRENDLEIESSRLVLPGQDEDFSKMFQDSKDQNNVSQQNDKNEETKEVVAQIAQQMGDEDDILDTHPQLQPNDDNNQQLMTNEENGNDSGSERKLSANIPLLKNNKNALDRNTKPFSYRLTNGILKIDVKDQQAVANQMLFEINLLAGKMLILQHKLIEVMKVQPRFVTEYLQLDYKEKMRDRWNESVFRSVLPTPNFALPTEENIGEIHRIMALNRRANQPSNKDTLKIEDKMMFSEQQIHPIIFEECYVIDQDQSFVNKCKNSNELTEERIVEGITGKNSQIISYVGVHLFILQHGFQGNSCDMRLLRNHISLMHPDAIVLCSSANEEQTEGDIFEMGERLANEVKQYIISFCPASCLARISFIGHSIGGLIIRAALPHLEEYKDKFYTYISLSSPHLGYMYNNNKLFDAGMWFLKKWRNSKCLTQLSMSDHSQIEQTALYKLTQAQGLGWFQNIVLFCSWQDQYVPFDSARIQICKAAHQDRSKGQTYIQMAQNLLSNLPTKLMYRLDVNFQIQDKNMDSWIGRTAHIQFLECQPLMKMLMYRYRELFS